MHAMEHDGVFLYHGGGVVWLELILGVGLAIEKDVLILETPQSPAMILDRPQTRTSLP